MLFLIRDAGCGSALQALLGDKALLLSLFQPHNPVAFQLCRRRSVSISMEKDLGMLVGKTWTMHAHSPEIQPYCGLH